MDTSKLVSTRNEAKKHGKKYYFTGKPCKHGHIAPRKTKGACVECLKVEWDVNAERRKDYFIGYNKSEAGKEAKLRYYEAHKEDVIARAMGRPLSEKRKYQKTWSEKNRDWLRANNKSRRRKHRLATPKWLSFRQRKAMLEIYRIARTTTKITGIPYVVDHIVPLQGEDVCGLHVPWNLQVITSEENLKKSNKHIDLKSVI